MSANLNFVDWEIYSQTFYEQEGACRCCLMTHPTHKCHKLCKLPKCMQAFLTNPCGNHYHKFIDCEDRKICDRCGNGGHTSETCVVPICHFCGTIGHIKPKCEKFIALQAFHEQQQVLAYMSYMFPSFCHIQQIQNHLVYAEIVPKKIDRSNHPKKFRHDPYNMTKNFVDVK